MWLHTRLCLYQWPSVWGHFFILRKTWAEGGHASLWREGSILRQHCQNMTVCVVPNYKCFYMGREFCWFIETFFFLIGYYFSIWYYSYCYMLLILLLNQSSATMRFTYPWAVTFIIAWYFLSPKYSLKFKFWHGNWDCCSRKEWTPSVSFNY